MNKINFIIKEKSDFLLIKEEAEISLIMGPGVVIYLWKVILSPQNSGDIPKILVRLFQKDKSDEENPATFLHYYDGKIIDDSLNQLEENTSDTYFMVSQNPNTE
jgi:hypothetical protein